MIQSLKCAYPWVNEIFYRDSMVFDYFLLPMTEFNITCLQNLLSFFLSHLFLLLFCSFAPTYVVFLFLFNFFHIFSFFFFFVFFLFVCLDIFKLFSFNSHKLFFFWKLSIDSIETIKPKRSHFGINLYLSVCSYFMGLFIYVFCVSIFTIYLCHLHQPVLGFFFFLFFSYLFHFCVDIFELFSQTQTLSNIFPKIFLFYF